MTTATSHASNSSRYELRFRPVFPSAAPFAFDCDAAGRIELDGLSRRDLNRYLYARALVGKSFFAPSVARCAAAAASLERP